jgi:hypothetical protein
VIRRALLIANPAARRAALRDAAVIAFERSGVRCDVLLT